MNRTAVVMKMHIRDHFTWFIIPWIVVLSSFVINLIISSFVNEPVYTGGLTSYFGYFMAAGIFTLNHTFPFALGLSIRRKDYMAGTLALLVVISLLSAIALLLLGQIERALNGWGTDLHFFNLPYLNDGNVLQQLWIFFIAVLHVYMFGTLFSSLSLRSGAKGVYAFLILMLLVGTLFSFFATRYGWWMEMIRWLIRHTAFELASWMGLVLIVYAGVSYLLLRKATV